LIAIVVLLPLLLLLLFEYPDVDDFVRVIGLSFISLGLILLAVNKYR